MAAGGATRARPGDELAAMVQKALHENPFAGDIFAIRATRADRVCLIGTGATLYSEKRPMARE
jgi:hypothetical protein